MIARGGITKTSGAWPRAYVRNFVNPKRANGSAHPSKTRYYTLGPEPESNRSTQLSRHWRGRAYATGGFTEAVRAQPRTRDFASDITHDRVGFSESSPKAARRSRGLAAVRRRGSWSSGIRGGADSSRKGRAADGRSVVSRRRSRRAQTLCGCSILIL